MRISSSLINFFKHLLFTVRVSGESGWPRLVAGKTYFASRIGPVHSGDFIVFKSPADSARFFIKKVIAVEANGYAVTSTVSWGSGSKDFGLVPKHVVIGRLLQ